MLGEIREKDFQDGVMNSYTEKLKEERETGGGVGSVVKKMGARRGRDKREGEKEEREKRERMAYLGAVECPICFLNYPPNINTTRCCQQPVCTECFVQIKRTEATVTHLESEAACCPYCVETDFGVIYERPQVDLRAVGSALGTSVDGESGFSAISFASSDIGPGMAPNVKDKVRRKSVSHKSAEVVTIDQIRPDWETKLNAVKAAAARRASRRIVMRQVGDRLIPVGFTSSRATGTADFSMSIPPDEGGSRRSRRRDDARDMEEQAMIMEAMRLSMIDHEEHQKKTAEEAKKASNSSVNLSAGSGSSTPIAAPQPSGPSKLRRLSLLASGNRPSSLKSHEGSPRSVSFAQPSAPSATPSSSHLHLPVDQPQPFIQQQRPSSQPEPYQHYPQHQQRLSMDMAPLVPDQAVKPTLLRTETELSGVSERTEVGPSYAPLESDEE
ncbi:hypothetical protein P7C73_g2906, partial [Tremellales sp. Uapishka_1]